MIPASRPSPSTTGARRTPNERICLSTSVMFSFSSTVTSSVTRVAKLATTNDRRALRAHLERLATLPGLVRLVPDHGAVMEGDAPATMRAIAATV
jgi:hypothetical protein